MWKEYGLHGYPNTAHPADKEPNTSSGLEIAVLPPCLYINILSDRSGAVHTSRLSNVNDRSARQATNHRPIILPTHVAEPVVC